MDRIGDRGMKKWQGLMIPEHVRMLRDWREELRKTERPRLDELDLRLMANEIERAYKSKSHIKLTYFRDGFLENDTGIIIEIDQFNKSLVLDNPFSTKRYSFDGIVVATIIEGRCL